MQIDEAVADVACRAIRKHEVLVQAPDFDTQNASRVMGIFDDGLPAAQYAVQPKDELVQPKMTLSPHRRPDQSPSPRFSHGIGCLTARLLQYYYLLICPGFQPAPSPPSHERRMTLKLVWPRPRTDGSSRPLELRQVQARRWGGME